MLMMKKENLTEKSPFKISKVGRLRCRRLKLLTPNLQRRRF
jgi:hypothetical protein